MTILNDHGTSVWQAMTANPTRVFAGGRPAFVALLISCLGIALSAAACSPPAPVEIYEEEEEGTQPYVSSSKKAKGKIVVHAPADGEPMSKTLNVVVGSRLSDGAEVDSFEVRVATKPLLEYVVPGNAGDKVQFSASLSEFPEGKLALTLVAWADGKKATWLLKLQVDRTGPSLHLAAPQPGALSGSVQLDVTIADKHFAEARFLLGDKVLAERKEVGRWVANIPLPPGITGDHTFHVRATDLPGNATVASAAVQILGNTRFANPQRTSSSGFSGGQATLTNAIPVDLDGDGKLDFLATTTGGDGMFYCESSCHMYAPKLLPVKDGVAWNAPLDTVTKGLPAISGGAEVELRWYVSAHGKAATGRLVLVGMIGREAYVVSELPLAGVLTAWQMVDVDGDGDPEIVGLRSLSDQHDIAVYRVDIPSKVVLDKDGLPPTLPSAITGPETFPGVGHVGQARHADFNGDGAQDLVFGRTAGSVFTICFADGKGGFLACQDTLLQGEPSPVVAAPYRASSDKPWDLIVAGFGSSSVIMLSNDGKGKFKQTATMPLSTAPTNIVVPPSEATTQICILGGSASFTMMNPTTGVDEGPVGEEFKKLFLCGIGYATSGQPTNVVAGDFDGDGATDLAAIVPSTGDMDILYGTAGGGFEAPIDLPFCVLPNQTKTKPTAMALADFEGDGKKDLVVVGRSTASFQDNDCAGAPIATPAWLYRDLAYKSTTETRYAEYRPLDKDKSTGKPSCEGKPNVVGLRAADVDGNGHPDLVATVAREYFIGTKESANGPKVAQMCKVDEQNEVDSFYDVGEATTCDLAGSKNAVGPGGGAPLHRTSALIFHNSGKGLGFTDKDMAGQLTPTFSLSAGLAPIAMTVGDLNGDQLPDLVTLMKAWGQPKEPDFLPARLRTFISENQQFSHAKQDGQATYTIKGSGELKSIKGTWLSTGPAPVAALIAADAQGPRLFVLDDHSQDVIVFDAKGAKLSVPGLMLATGGLPTAFAVADLDGDKWLDIIVARVGWLMVVFSDGNGSYGQTASHALWKGTPAATGVGDFNADGLPDVAVALRDTNRVGLLLGTGKGKLAKLNNQLPVNAGPAEMLVEDINNDGYDDIMVRCVDGRSVTVIASSKALKVWN